MEYWPNDADIIQVDADHKMLGLVKDITVGICGDDKAGAQELLERIQDRTHERDSTTAERGQTIQAEKVAWEKELDEWIHENDEWSLQIIK